MLEFGNKPKCSVCLKETLHTLKKGKWYCKYHVPKEKVRIEKYRGRSMFFDNKGYTQ